MIQVPDGSHDAFDHDGSLDYGSLQFEDMSGNPVDGHACDVIYVEDDDIPVQRLVNPDGSVEYILDADDADGEDWKLRESPVTSAETHLSTAGLLTHAESCLLVFLRAPLSAMMQLSAVSRHYLTLLAWTFIGDTVAMDDSMITYPNHFS